jgi:hypothetical protein
VAVLGEIGRGGAGSISSIQLKTRRRRGIEEMKMKKKRKRKMKMGMEEMKKKKVKSGEEEEVGEDERTAPKRKKEGPNRKGFGGVVGAYRWSADGHVFIALSALLVLFIALIDLWIYVDAFSF